MLHRSARCGDASGSDHTLNEAERALDRSAPDDEPFWIRFFTPQQLATESMYVAADLGRSRHVSRHAETALRPADGMQRRQVLATATLARSHLTDGTASPSPVDVEQACQALRGVVPVLASLTSARALASVNQVRERLASYADVPAVRELEDELYANAGQGLSR